MRSLAVNSFSTVTPDSQMASITPPADLAAATLSTLPGLRAKAANAESAWRYSLAMLDG